ncbi:rRNA adenine N-6-methyltransferase family protein [Brevibacterium luteolum]|uniref:Uncharacterized protein n=1 Tax=Brevibacterium luteolum TaxID=199591 RepID=A0A2N6PG89_9MICO|nr:rRNA adenine N-6-methyltransferase family protein [Brevibacterium luteolum]PMB97709.1 hypothetical protein CJ198_09920 [Brevibacterium luteolum]
MPTYRGGRHEHGQNYLIDSHTITTLIGAVAESRGPIIEIGPGRGAQTHRLASLGRVPRSAFRPMPSGDGGMLRMTWRAAPLLAESDRRAYRGFVHAVFSGCGRGLPEILSRIVGQRARQAGKGWLARAGLGVSTLPKDLSAEQWAGLYALAAGCGWSPGGAVRRSRGGGRR